MGGMNGGGNLQCDGEHTEFVLLALLVCLPGKVFLPHGLLCLELTRILYDRTGIEIVEEEMLVLGQFFPCERIVVLYGLKNSRAVVFARARGLYDAKAGW